MKKKKKKEKRKDGKEEQTDNGAASGRFQQTRTRPCGGFRSRSRNDRTSRSLSTGDNGRSRSKLESVSFETYLETQLRDVLVRREDDTGTLRNFGVFEWKAKVVVADLQFVLRFVLVSNLKSAGSTYTHTHTHIYIYIYMDGRIYVHNVN